MSTFIAARNGYGLTFSYSSVGSSGTFVQCANVISCTLPQVTRGSVDVTNHGTTDAYEQCISGGIIRTGNIGFSAVFLTTASEQITTIPTDFRAGTRSGWKLVIPGASSYNTWYGDGYITAYNITIPQDGMVGFDMTMKVTGQPTLATTTT